LKPGKPEPMQIDPRYYRLTHDLKWGPHAADLPPWRPAYNDTEEEIQCKNCGRWVQPGETCYVSIFTANILGCERCILPPEE